MGRAMTREELRVYALDDWSCSCGQPEAAAQLMLRLLDLHPLYENREALDEWLPDTAVQEVLLYQIDRIGLNEHGGSVGGSWLTAKGEAARDGLRREAAEDGCEMLTSGADDHGYCIHGFDVTDHEHDCMTAPEPAPWKPNDSEPTTVDDATTASRTAERP